MRLKWRTRIVGAWSVSRSKNINRSQILRRNVYLESTRKSNKNSLERKRIALMTSVSLNLLSMKMLQLSNTKLSSRESLRRSRCSEKMRKENLNLLSYELTKITKSNWRHIEEHALKSLRKRDECLMKKREGACKIFSFLLRNLISQVLIKKNLENKLKHSTDNKEP